MMILGIGKAYGVYIGLNSNKSCYKPVKKKKKTFFIKLSATHKQPIHSVNRLIQWCSKLSYLVNLVT